MATGHGNNATDLYPGPADAALHRQWRTERRAVVRHHHPDRGGAVGVMQRELDLVDRRFRFSEGDRNGTADQVGMLEGSFRSTQAPAWQPVARAARRARRMLSRQVRTARAKIPPGWPGHRRYINL